MRVPVRVERLGLAPGAVEGEHQLTSEPLAQRVNPDQPLELSDHRAVAAEREVDVDPLLDRGHAELLEAGDLRLRERLVGEVRQRRPAPQVERLAKSLGCARRVPPPGDGNRHLELALETLRVERLGLGPQRIPPRPGRQDLARRPLGALRLEQPAQLSDVDLERVRRRRRWGLAPEGIDQPVARDRFVRVHEQDREQRTLLGGGQRQHAPLITNLERSEDAELHRRPLPSAN